MLLTFNSILKKIVKFDDQEYNTLLDRKGNALTTYQQTLHSLGIKVIQPAIKL